MPTVRRPVIGLLIAWLCAGAFFLFSATWPPVSRTQEARVLETAREMADRPVSDWAIPRLNDAVRLRKPPLAYWMSAASFRVFGVNDFAGRLPMTLLAWASLGTTFLIARRLFDERVAFFAAAVLAGTWLYFKSAMLAETDGPTAAFLTLGVYAFLRASDAARRGHFSGPVFLHARDALWLHLLAACGALAILCKGPPAIYLALTVVGLCAVRRQWRPARRFFTSGAVVTLLVIAVPWFLYIARHSTEEGPLGRDFLNSAEGGDHHAPPWYYVPLLVQATLPWTAVWAAAGLAAGWRLWRARADGRTTATPVAQPNERTNRPGSLHEAAGLGRRDAAAAAPLAVTENVAAANAFARPVPLDTSPVPQTAAPSHAAPVAPAEAGGFMGISAGRRDALPGALYRVEPGLVTIAVWGLAVLVPLCFWGNKQLQYLLPVMTPTAILIGWGLAGAVGRQAWATAPAVATGVTAAALTMIPFAAGVVTHSVRVKAGEAFTRADATLVTVLLGVVVFAALQWRRLGRPAGVAALCLLAGGAMFFALAWMPAITGGRGRNAAIEVRSEYPDGHFYFRGSELPVMSWALRRAVPFLDEPALEAKAADPRAVVLEQQQDDEHEPTPPAGFVRHQTIPQRENTLHVYVPATRQN